MNIVQAYSSDFEELGAKRIKCSTEAVEFSMVRKNEVSGMYEFHPVCPIDKKPLVPFPGQGALWDGVRCCPDDLLAPDLPYFHYFAHFILVDVAAIKAHQYFRLGNKELKMWVNTQCTSTAHRNHVAPLDQRLFRRSNMGICSNWELTGEDKLISDTIKGYGHPKDWPEEKRAARLKFCKDTFTNLANSELKAHEMAVRNSASKKTSSQAFSYNKSLNNRTSTIPKYIQQLSTNASLLLTCPSGAGSGTQFGRYFTSCMTNQELFPLFRLSLNEKLIFGPLNHTKDDGIIPKV